VTPPEIAATCIGLIAGYWLVNAYISGKKPPESTDSPGPGADRFRQPPFGVEPLAPQWYEILGVGVFATREEITAAYKRRISEYHPDKVAQLGDEIREVAERKSKQINAAYDEAMRRF